MHQAELIASLIKLSQQNGQSKNNNLPKNQNSEKKPSEMNSMETQLMSSKGNSQGALGASWAQSYKFSQTSPSKIDENLQKINFQPTQDQISNQNSNQLSDKLSNQLSTQLSNQLSNQLSTQLSTRLSNTQTPKNLLPHIDVTKNFIPPPGFNASINASIPPGISQNNQLILIWPQISF